MMPEGDQETRGKVRKYRNEISNNLKAVLWIRIGSVFNGVPGSGFGCKKAKAQKNRKQFKNIIVLSAGYGSGFS
jgi:hypothetical protein